MKAFLRLGVAGTIWGTLVMTDDDDGRSTRGSAGAVRIRTQTAVEDDFSFTRLLQRAFDGHANQGTGLVSDFHLSQGH